MNILITTNVEACEALAEAMGIQAEWAEHDFGPNRRMAPGYHRDAMSRCHRCNQYGGKKSTVCRPALPNPFTSADAFLVVLEWWIRGDRNTPSVMWHTGRREYIAFITDLDLIGSHASYRHAVIGAILKALGHEVEWEEIP